MQQSIVRAVKMSYLRTCALTRSEGESNGSMYERCGMGICTNEIEVECIGMGEKKYIERVCSYGEEEE